MRAPDRPGFLVGALLYPHLADAVRMVQDGYASAADVDTAMTLGCGYPRGPLELLDEAGPATALAVLEAMHRAYGDPAFAPPPLLADYAAAGLRFGTESPPGFTYGDFREPGGRRGAAATDEPSAASRGPAPGQAWLQPSAAGESRRLSQGRRRSAEWPDGEWVVRQVPGAGGDQAVPLSRL